MIKEEETEADWLVIEKYLEILCEDIKAQRERIGGDWAVARPHGQGAREL